MNIKFKPMLAKESSMSDVAMLERLAQHNKEMREERKQMNDIWFLQGTDIEECEFLEEQSKHLNEDDLDTVARIKGYRDSPQDELKAWFKSGVSRAMWLDKANDPDNRYAWQYGLDGKKINTIPYSKMLEALEEEMEQMVTMYIRNPDMKFDNKRFEILSDKVSADGSVNKDSALPRW